MNKSHWLTKTKIHIVRERETQVTYDREIKVKDTQYSKTSTTKKKHWFIKINRDCLRFFKGKIRHRQCRRKRDISKVRYV